ncbi:uncharacterized protein TNCV_5118511 [Trichonephila clavipes]|nr:uncharacterized protein TNCV_5118511 [Trichonephila clavipes]
MRANCAHPSIAFDAEVHEQMFRSGGQFEARPPVFKSPMHLRHGGTQNSRRAASPLVRLVEGEERWEDPNHPQGVLPKNWSGTEQTRTVTCMVLKAKANDRRKNLALSHDEFRGP